MLHAFCFAKETFYREPTCTNTFKELILRTAKTKESLQFEKCI